MIHVFVVLARQVSQCPLLEKLVTICPVFLKIKTIYDIGNLTILLLNQEREHCYCDLGPLIANKTGKSQGHFSKQRPLSSGATHSHQWLSWSHWGDIHFYTVHQGLSAGSVHMGRGGGIEGFTPYKDHYEGHGPSQSKPRRLT